MAGGCNRKAIYTQRPNLAPALPCTREPKDTGLFHLDVQSHCSKSESSKTSNTQHRASQCFYAASSGVGRLRLYCGAACCGSIAIVTCTAASTRAGTGVGRSRTRSCCRRAGASTSTRLGYVRERSLLVCFSMRFDCFLADAARCLVGL